MSSRILIPLAVAAALMAPMTASAEKGDWLFRVGLSQVNPDETNLETSLGDIVADSDLSPTFNISYFLTNNISTELLAAWPFTHGLDLKTGGGGIERVGYFDHLPPT